MGEPQRLDAAADPGRIGLQALVLRRQPFAARQLGNPGGMGGRPLAAMSRSLAAAASASTARVYRTSPRGTSSTSATASVMPSAASVWRPRQYADSRAYKGQVT